VAVVPLFSLPRQCFEILRSFLLRPCDPLQALLLLCGMLDLRGCSCSDLCPSPLLFFSLSRGYSSTGILCYTSFRRDNDGAPPPCPPLVYFGNYFFPPSVPPFGYRNDYVKRHTVPLASGFSSDLIGPPLTLVLSSPRCQVIFSRSPSSGSRDQPLTRASEQRLLGLRPYLFSIGLSFHSLLYLWVRNFGLPAAMCLRPPPPFRSPPDIL